MDPKMLGGGYGDNDTRFISEATSWLNNRVDSGNTKPFAMAFSVNPHDVSAYPFTWGEGDRDSYLGYTADMIEGDMKILSSTVTETITGFDHGYGYDFAGNYKPQIQRKWLRAQLGAQPFQRII